MSSEQPPCESGGMTPEHGDIQIIQNHQVSLCPPGGGGLKEMDFFGQGVSGWPQTVEKHEEGPISTPPNPAGGPKD